MRKVKDSMGELTVPSDVWYGAQTQRAIQNFPLSGWLMPKLMIQSLLHIKKAAAISNGNLGGLNQVKVGAIVQACQELLADQLMMRHFPVDVFQTGSATSTNMNVNEVVAFRASQIASMDIHANDDVNQSQSSNDVIPSAIHVAASLAFQTQLKPSMMRIGQTIQEKINQVGDTVKTGRTHLMDAMPIRLGQSMSAWLTQVEMNQVRLNTSVEMLNSLPLGGTAVGTGVNAPKEFSQQACDCLNQDLQTGFYSAKNKFAQIASQDILVSFSGQLKTLAVTLTKIANDLRWMNSGPNSGLAEIKLEALQPGSSIMPGKTNPVIPESVMMVAAHIMGSDTTLAIAGQSGNFELNTMLPLMAYHVLNNVSLLGNACDILGDNAIRSFEVNQNHIKASLMMNPILVTALNPIIGYEKSAAIVKKALDEKRSILDVAIEMTELSKEELELLLNPSRLTG